MSVESIVDRRHPRSTELERRSAALLLDTEFTASLLANSKDAITILNLDARIEFFSPGGLDAMEIDDGDAILGTSWFALWSRDSQVQAMAAVEQAKTGGTVVFEGMRSTSHDPGWWEVTVSPIAGSASRPERLLAIARDITERKIAQQSHHKLMEEFHHRVKNMLAMAMAITSQSLARAKSTADGRLAVEHRLMALAEAHNLLRDSGPDGADLQEIVGRCVRPYDVEPSRFTITGADLLLSSPAALALAMAIHELGTNAVKYGALSASAGRVEISWNVEETSGQFRLTWRESGGPPVQAPAGRGGFGMRVIDASFRGQLRGTAKVSFEPSGVVCVVEAPISALQDVADAAGRPRRTP